MNLQYIKDDKGNAQFVVLPISEFNRLAALDEDLQYVDIPYERGDNDDEEVPHEVVEIMMTKEVSLLAAWRLFRHLSQQDVAELAGLTQSAISQAEKANKPHKSTCEKLAEIYKCRPSQLYL